jgi:hypothetical protein
MLVKLVFKSYFSIARMAAGRLYSRNFSYFLFYLFVINMINDKTLIIHRKRRKLFTIVTNPKGSKRGRRQFEEISHFLIIVLQTKSHEIGLDHFTHTIKV